jgi:hypothetical protein
MKRYLALPVLCLVIAGCSTPVVLLKNPTNGQVARCGGDATGSFVGGVIGYHMQKSNDEGCVRDYEAMGFKRVGQ